MSIKYTHHITSNNTVRGGVRLMKGQESNIRRHMVRGARINDPIRRITKIRVMNHSVGIGCIEGLVRSSGKGRRKRSKCRGG